MSTKIDINECNDPNICHASEKCDNYPGYYKCTLMLVCDEGFEMNEAKNECIGKE
jgi:hypothetical protein